MFALKTVLYVIEVWGGTPRPKTMGEHLNLWVTSQELNVKYSAGFLLPFVVLHYACALLLAVQTIKKWFIDIRAAIFVSMYIDNIDIRYLEK